jgi:hypothetical protein
MFDSTSTAILKLEPAPGGIKWSSDIVAGRLSHRMFTETTLPLGVPIDLKDIPYLIRDPSLVSGTMLITSPSDDSLQMQLDFKQGGRTVIRYDISPDGNTLTISVPPPESARMVFDKQ